MSRTVLCGLMLALCPVLGSAQGNIPVHLAYKRAQTLVNDGNAAAGRAVVDSMIALAAPGSNEFVEGVYWRAVLAVTAADAEMDYRRIVVDYPASPRVEDALIRLAQLEMARGNSDAALRHLNKLVAEHPESPARARAGYWMARALFDKNEIQGGCAATADALARTSEDNAELRNQIIYLNQRCAGVVLAGPTTATPVPLPASPASPVAASPIGPPSVAAPPRDSASIPRVTATARDSAGIPATTTPARVIESVSPASPRDTASAVQVKPPLQPPLQPPASSAEGNRVYSVQIAAYTVRSQADAMVARLKKNGYEARVDGTSAPFRVRIGKYATQAQASAVQRSLKAKQITGFVVQAEPR